MPGGEEHKDFETIGPDEDPGSKGQRLPIYPPRHAVPEAGGVGSWASSSDVTWKLARKVGSQPHL